MLGSYASNDLHGAVGHDSGSGNDQPGSGNGSGSTGNGSGGGAGAGAGNGNGMLPAPPERAKDKEIAKANHGEAHGQKDQSHEADDDQLIGSDLEVLLDDGRAVKAAYISQDSAAYYRTRDDMPGLPPWLAGHREYTMLFRICVTTEGTVSNVVVLKSANPDADQVLCTAIENWRYRPRIVDGVARPFCHPIRIVYSRP
jgi:TonB family protein